MGSIGQFDELGFEHQRYRYAVRPGSDGRILPPDWRLDNFQVDRRGRPTDPRVGSEYTTTIGLDIDGDGERDDVVDTYRYDLRYLHRQHAGAIWLRTFPL